MIEFRDGAVDSGDGATLEAATRAEMATRYPGLDLRAPGMPPAGPAELSPPDGAFLIGYEDRMPVCCGGIKRLQAGVCELKRMHVVPAARGRGTGRLLLAALEQRARELGYTVARLCTGERQPDAQHLYASAGYVEIPNFNGDPLATYFGEKHLS